MASVQRSSIEAMLTCPCRHTLQCFPVMLLSDNVATYPDKRILRHMRSLSSRHPADLRCALCQVLGVCERCQGSGFLRHAA